MSRSFLLLASGLAVLAACSNDQPGNAAADTAEAPAPANSTTSSAPAPVPAADFRQLAECVAKVEAVSRLYRAVASQSSGAEAAEMNNRASQRSLAAFDLRTKAEEMEGVAPGSADAQVPKIISETETELENERSSRPFDEFAIWIGQESDRCATLLPTRT